MITSYRTIGDRVDVMAAMNTARLLIKFQVSAEKSIRMVRRWQAGQVFAVIPKSEGVFPLPVRCLGEFACAAGNCNVGLAMIPRLHRPIWREAR